MGWRLPAESDRWILWLEGGVQALLSVESAPTGAAVRVDLVRPQLTRFVEVVFSEGIGGLTATLLEEIVSAAVEGDLVFAPVHRNAWAIAIRSTAQLLGVPEGLATSQQARKTTTARQALDQREQRL